MHSGRKKASGRRAFFCAGTSCAPTPTEPKDGDENDKNSGLGSRVTSDPATSMVRNRLLVTNPDTTQKWIL